MIEKVSSFLNEFKFEDIPKVAIDNSLRSFVDLIGVAASATQTDLSKIIRKHCKNFYAPNPNQGILSSCLLYTSPSQRDLSTWRMQSSS